jgi:Fe-S-cluster-containing dehydrogenase component/DMSO reductase anchor subunit
MTTSTFPPTREMRTLIDALLEEQGDLTAVERFARWHETNGQPPAPRHSALIPLSAPRPGEQYAFEVDLDRCSGCKSCVTACHSLNGLDEEETWRSVGLLHGRGRGSFQQTITTACHHCVDPACLNGCPVLAYDKDPLTGIVRHLDDQCIGCQYCVFMCPYDVPKYSERRGIVRKCDMCHQRLAHGEAPACVQACPSEAIRISVVNQTDLARNFSARQLSLPASTNRFLPGSPDPAITLPTTRYVSARALPADLRAGDAHETKLQHAHLPLVWMLVLTQLGAGGFVFLPLSTRAAQPVLAGIALAATLLGLAGSVFHLGQPLKAWRVFLGLRRSWLSREIVAFGVFASLAIAATWMATVDGPPFWKPTCFWAASLAGLLGVLCSGMTYHATRRECWRGEFSLGRFFGTTMVLGLAAGGCAATMCSFSAVAFAAALPLVMLMKLAREFALLRRCPDDAGLNDELPDSILGRSAFLMRFRLGGLLRFRLACAWIGGVCCPLLGLLNHSAASAPAVCALFLCIAGELTERVMFFRAAQVPRMPGGLAE